MNRRSFLRSALAGAALTIAAPILARFAPKPHVGQIGTWNNVRFVGVDFASGPDVLAMAEVRSAPISHERMYEIVKMIQRARVTTLNGRYQVDALPRPIGPTIGFRRRIP